MENGFPEGFNFEDLFSFLNVDERTLEEKIMDAEAGDEATMEVLAISYLNGDDETQPDPEKAVYWFEKLAERNNSDAQFNLGLHCAKGHGTERSFEKAAYWMRRAAENGDADAPVLVEKYTKLSDAVGKAEEGDAQAMADLARGLMELAGSLEQAGVGRDYDDAFRLAEKAAEQDNADGLWVLALAYEHGRGVEQNIEKALECYRRGTELGHAPSQHGMACYLMRGDFLEKDAPRAVELSLKSAEQGYELAYFFLAKAYELGDGVEENLGKALEWGEKAAENGSADVRYEVAKMYMYSDESGKMPEAERARYWLGLAAEQGHEMAWDMLNFAPVWNDDFGAEEEVSDMDDEYGRVLEAMEAAINYEEELYNMGILPDEPYDERILGAFPRIRLKAAEGDETAQKILSILDED